MFLHNELWYRIVPFFALVAQLSTTLVWIECDGPDGSYFLEWWGHIFCFCAKSYIIISLLSKPVSLFILIGCIAFQFFFWVLMGCFLCLEFSGLTCLFIGNQRKTCLVVTVWMEIITVSMFWSCIFLFFFFFGSARNNWFGQL